VNKAERNEKIVQALRLHGTMSGAARQLGVDRATVRRLVACSAQASEAFVDGHQRLLMTRIKQHSGRVQRAWALLCGSRTRHRQMCRDLAKGYADMTSDQLLQFEAELEPVYLEVRLCLRKLRACDKAHRRSLCRYVEVCAGMEL